MRRSSREILLALLVGGGLYRLVGTITLPIAVSTAMPASPDASRLATEGN